ncbi:MAG: hypothetical protein KUG78_19210 [Kangiellaceae bacterium]|nr:hypothetical protein [Kangiellaceae bacterium]
MTLTTKKSRPITVDDVVYRYQVSTTNIDDDWNFTLNLTVQIVEPKGGALLVKGLVTRDFWLDFSYGPKWNQGDYPTILPRHLAIIVRKAISKGWEPRKNGKAFEVSTTNESFFNEKT